MVKAVAAAKKTRSTRTQKSDHDRIIGALPKPSWMVNDSPLDNEWIVRTHGGNVRKGDVTVKFDVVIAPGVRSIDLEIDLITAKLLAFRGLTGNDARYDSGATIPINNRNYFAFVRWRHARGIERNAELTKDDIDDLVKDLEVGGIVGLPPYRQRLAELIQKIETGEFEIPFYCKGNKKYARKEPLANALGAPHTRSLPASVSHDLDDFIRGQGLSIQPRKGAGQDDEEDDLVNEIDEGALSENRIISFLTAPQLLFYYRKYLTHDPIKFEPFEGEDGISKIGKSICRVAAERSFTTPAYQACFLVNQAITWITTYFDEIRDFTNDLDDTIKKYEALNHWRPTEAAFNERLREDRDKYTTAPGSWWPIHPSYFAAPGWTTNISEYRPALRPVLFELLATAALVVIAAFAARRKEEMGSLKADCISTVDGEFWLETWISKNLHGMDKIPVPTTVKKAVDVLLWLSEEGRLSSESAWILDFAEFVVVGEGSQASNPAYRFYDGLDRFAEFVGVPLIDGKRWIPKPIEYRRFFGMTYFHRFHYPSLVALSDFYRHFNPTRTRGYIIEIAYGTVVTRQGESAERRKRAERRVDNFAQDRLKDFEECGLQFRLAIVRDAITGEGYLTGFGGTTIVNDAKKQVDDYKAQINLGPGEDLDRPTLNNVLGVMVKPMSFEPHPAGHGLCKCTGKTQDLATANCVRSWKEAYPNAPAPSGPVIEFATESACGLCVHNMQLQCNRRWWADALEHEKHEREHALLPFLREIAAQRAAMIDGVLKRCHPDPKS